MNIQKIIKEYAEKSPDAPAIIGSGRTPLSYGRLYEHILYVNEKLSGMGIHRNDRIALVLPNGPEMATAFLGVASCATCAPLNPGYKSGEFDFYLSDLNPRVLLMTAGVNSPALDVAKKHGIPVIELTASKKEAGIFTLHSDRTASQGFAESDDIALILHTSGTTSRPKIVPLTQTNICASAHNVQSTLKLTCDDRSLNIMPLFHIHGLIGVLLSSIAAGASVICSPGFDGLKFFDWMKEFQPTWYSAVPTMHQAILARAPENLEIIHSCPLKFIRSSSASLPPSIMTELENIFNAPVIEAYGMTEASHQMACNPLPPGKRKAGSVGPDAGPEVAIMDNSGKLLKYGETGEIVIRGQNITLGYENNPEANKSSFTNGWFRTGDQGYLDAEGYLFITGRLKEIINRGGEKISPREIDEILLEHPAVKQAVTFAMPHKQLGEDVAAAIVLKKDSVTQREIQEFVSERVADFKIPRQVIFLDEIPKGSTGKLQRIGLAEKLGVTGDDFAAGNEKTEFVAPRTQIEKKLVKIWSEVLSLDKLGINDNFLRLGGDSVLAAQIITNVRKTFNVEISLIVFFGTPSVANMALEIERLKKSMQNGTAPAPLLPSIIPDPDHKYLPFPLMEIQQAYWIGRSGIFPLGNVATHRYMEIDAEKTDLGKFETTFQKLIERHDMLRSVVSPDGMQRILEHTPPYEIKILDLCEQTPEQTESLLKAVREEMSHQVLPSDQWPIFEIRASRLSSDRYIIHFSLDAIVLDIWSRFIIFREWEQLYNNPDVVLKKLELSFRDYVLAEQSLKNSSQYKRSKEYWLKRLPKMPPGPELPLAKSPESIKKQRVIRWKQKLESGMWVKLKKNGAMASVTPSGILLAAFSDVLKVWCRQSEFTLNMTIYNALPLHHQVSEVVGDFTSLNLLAVDHQRYDSFAKRAKNLQKQFLNDMDHRYFSGLKVLRELASRQTSQSNAMPIVFTSALTHVSKDKEENPMNWIGKIIYGITQTPQVWIDHQVFEESGSLAFNWDVVAELFPDGLIDDMFAAYCAFLNRLANDENTWHESWSETAAKLVPQYQTEQRKAVNATETEISDKTLHSLFASQAKQRPGQTAVVSSDRTLTYKELYVISNQIGHKLRKEGALPDSLIGVVMEKGWEQVAAVLGILAAGAAYLPIDPGLPDERFQYLLEYGKVDMALTVSSLTDLLEWPEGVRRFCVDSEDFAEESSSLPEQIITPENLAYVIFTSGSTGLPKGVIIDHRGAVNTMLDINSRFAATSEDKTLAISSLSFDLSVYDIFGTLAAGGAIIMPDQSAVRDPSQWARLIKEHEVTIWNSVPALMGLLTEYVENRSEKDGPPVLESLRLILMSGDWIPPALPEQIRKVSDNPRIVSLGGATEASVWSILYPIEEDTSGMKSVPYGKPMANQRLYVLNTAMEACPVWVQGQLYIGGVGLAKGYWRDKEKTEKSFVTHPKTGEQLYCTGDMGRYLPDGDIEFLGREDFQVKIQGFRVETGEIETALATHPDIKAAVVEAVGKLHEEKRLAAYFVPEFESAPTTDTLRDFLRQKLPDYMIPSVYVPLEELPLTGNGKVDRKSLPPPDFRKPEVKKAGDTVSSGLGTRVADFVEHILDTRNIAPDKNMLNIGATSIHMIRIANRVETEFKFRPEIDELYANPTIAWLTTLCERETGVEEPDAGRDVAIAMPGDMLTQFDFIADPEERQTFKETLPGLRESCKPDIQLSAPGSDEKRIGAYKKRRTCRTFSAEPISFENFGRFLSCMRPIQQNGMPKYLYGSAGGLYPVQTYFHIKPDRVRSVNGGIYYYHPAEHGLVSLSDKEDMPETVYDPLINRPIFTQAAFGIFLITQLEAIVPMYKERSLHYSVIEAGLISQLMESHAPDFNLGLCQIGSLDFEKIRHLFKLDKTHMLVHSLLGGMPADNRLSHGEI